MQLLLELENISKSYQNKQALKPLSLSIPRGSVYGLLGPNGAGKTTLIRIITHITGPDTGTMHFDGKPGHPDDVRRMGYMPEERGLYKKMTVWDQLLFFARLKGLSGAEAEKRIVHWLRKLEMVDWAKKKVEELSKGMAQKVQFIATVIHEPEFLILDEPFSGFDPVNADIIKQEILELRDKGVTILFSTHRMESVEEMCDAICLIHQSEKVLDGSIRDIRKQFRSRRYRIVTKDPYQTNLPMITAEPAGQNNDGHPAAHINLPETMSYRELLNDILNQTELIAFEEFVPSVHDIFVMKVKGEMA
jgi:ABC-2 type transport system ATP-binding protein